MTDQPNLMEIVEPEHEDFFVMQAMIESLNQEFAEANEEGREFDLAHYLAEYVDTNSLAFVAIQRAITVLRVSAEEVEARIDEVTQEASAFQDGFLMGVRFQQFQVDKNKPQEDIA